MTYGVQNLDTSIDIQIKSSSVFRPGTKVRQWYSYDFVKVHLHSGECGMCRCSANFNCYQRIKGMDGSLEGDKVRIFIRKGAEYPWLDA